MFKIAICDDNLKIIRQLKEYCETYFIMNCVRYDIHCYQSCTKLIMNCETYDAFFIDIEMPEMNGIELGKIIREHNTSSQIIVISGYDKYKPIAYGIHPFDFVDKPFNQNTIYQVLDDFVQYRKAHKEPPHIMIKTDSEMLPLSIQKIMYIEIINRRTIIHYKLEEVYKVYTPLSLLFEQLACHGFLMPHNAFIVNYRYIKKYKRYEIELTTSVYIPISQSRYKTFEKEIHMNILKY